MKRTALLILLALSLLTPALSAAQDKTANPADALVIPAGQTRRGDVATVSQPIVVDGVVEGDVTSIRGTIIVRGAVEGDVVSLFGDVIFEEGAVSDGNIMAATGQVQAPPALELAAGHTLFNGNLGGRGMASLIGGGAARPASLGGQLLLIGILALMGLVGAVLISLIWPRSIAAGARAIRLAPDRAFGLSLLWLLMSAIALALATAVLTLTLVGLTALPLLILIGHLPFVVGLATSGRALGERLGQRDLAATLLGCALILLPGVALASLHLALAFAVFYLLAGAGIGGLFLNRAAVIQRHGGLA